MISRFAWLAVTATLLGAGCGPKAPDQAANPTTSSPADQLKTGAPIAKLTKLEIVDKKVGTGPGAQNGDLLSVKYTGRLADGTVFDSNDKPDGKPLNMPLGAGKVIKGWDKGLVGVKQGGERSLSIPPDLAYGSAGSGKIGPNSDLFFDIKVLSLIPKANMNEVTIDDKVMGSGPGLKDGDIATLTYVGSSLDGQEFDSTKARGNTPMVVSIGVEKGSAKRLIPALEAALIGMKKGGERIVVIPPGMGPPIPAMAPGSPAKYDIKLIDVKQK